MSPGRLDPGPAGDALLQRLLGAAPGAPKLPAAHDVRPGATLVEVQLTRRSALEPFLRMSLRLSSVADRFEGIREHVFDLRIR